MPIVRTWGGGGVDIMTVTVAGWGMESQGVWLLYGR